MTTPRPGPRRPARWRRPAPALLGAVLLAALLPAAPAQAAPICSVDYQLNDWGSGFTAEVSVTNEADSVSDWTLGWEFSGNQRISNSWSAQVSQSGSSVTASGPSWAPGLASGQTATFGFQATYSGTNEVPADFTLNGLDCAGEDEEPEPEDPTLVVDPDSVTLEPGGEAAFDVALSEAPAEDVAVSVERTSGSSTLSVASGASLAFGEADWDTPQEVTVASSGDGSGDPARAEFTVSAEGYDPVVVTARELSGASNAYEEEFLAQYDKIKDPDSGYFREFDGLLVPYHSVETLIVEAPDHGHATTSEAYSYYLWLEATYGRITGDWGPFNSAWESMEAFIIPGTADQPTNGSYDPSAPATYIPESLDPSDYPMPLDDSVESGQDPLAQELSSTYGTDEVYGMHWLLDVDNTYGYGFCGDGTDEAPAYVNTFQRGSNESVWETVPHPSCETFQHGGENGFLDLFTDDDDYSEQWRYTNAPDADARAVQVAYLAHEWASEQGNEGAIAENVSNAAMMGDYLRYAMFDKYFKEIGDCVDPQSCPPGSGKDSAHYLMAWYYSWGGALESAQYPWAWRIGGSSAHQGYQNVMAAYALSEVSALQPESATGTEDWGTSLDRQLEFLEWLQSSDGAIAGGATNSWEGAYTQPPSGTPTFYGMFYDEKPVWHDPPSNRWFGFQVWDMERVAEYHRITGDERAGDILDDWVPWAIANTTVGENGEFAIPADMEWSGRPDTWTGESTGNPDLSVEVVSHGQDVGIAAGLAKTLMHYAAATGDADSRATAEGLLDALLANQDDLGVAVPETRADYARFDDEFGAPDGGLYIPEGWTGQMPNGDPVDSDSTFLSIRSFYEDDPNWPQVEEYLNGGPVPEFTYHRFWAQVDVATALATHGELFGDGA
ncbi:cellulose binding domain-containing protein [Nocardiopsis akebiae]|uniref:Cellulose binding domain-containing protein n=1 Tax=Nocardiopsis akebiae TaxID=2831968 RepID=A0ABX8CE38_9ACTN|nr:glycoside hydrolase family 48 protein [Nocardiopsis akebiae]QUX31371.1 cellulose binding domain-containing protein [Nocardiopsis akebiae]